MTRSKRGGRTTLSRRTVLAGVAAGLMSVGARAEGEPVTLKVGLLPFGTVQWEVETILR